MLTILSCEPERKPAEVASRYDAMEAMRVAVTAVTWDGEDDPPDVEDLLAALDRQGYVLAKVGRG